MFDSVTRALADARYPSSRRITLDSLGNEQFKAIGFQRTETARSPVRFADFG